MYLVNVALYAVSLVLFENRIFILGVETNLVSGAFVRIALIFIPFYVAFRLRVYALDAWVLAVSFHLFFLVNNATILFERLGFGHAIMRIAGLYGGRSYSRAQLICFALATVLNSIIFVYLICIRKHFFVSNQEDG
jgi:hypothetical protein